MLGRLRTLVNAALAPLGVMISKVENGDGRLKLAEGFLPVDEPNISSAEGETRRLLNVLGYTKLSGSAYSAESFESGYHSVAIEGRVFRGQREPSARLDITPFDFTGKSVLDIGCNQGGMLFAVAPKIKSGVGVDFDPRMINAANRLRANRRDANLNFYVFDLEREPLSLLDSLRQQTQVDIVFLLSVAMWIRNWRQVVEYARAIAPALLFETNGSDEQQAEQESFLRSVYARVRTLQDTSPDDSMQRRRRLLFCEA